MTDDRIEKLKNNLELMNSNIADDLTVRVENWIIENKITRPEAEKILEKMTKGLFLHDRLEVILGSHDYDEDEPKTMFNRKIFADDQMTEDLNLHVEAMRALFKKRFSGGIEYPLGDKSPDIFKGKDDININEVDWSDEIIGFNYVDEFPVDLSNYISEKKLAIETVEKIIEIFKQKTKNFDERIWDRLEIILDQWDDYIS